MQTKKSREVKLRRRGSAGEEMNSSLLAGWAARATMEDLRHLGSVTGVARWRLGTYRSDHGVFADA